MPPTGPELSPPAREPTERPGPGPLGASFFAAHATGLTIVATAALALAVSLAPVPDALRPIPSLAKDRLPEALAGILLPERDRQAARPPSPQVPALPTPARPASGVARLAPPAGEPPRPAAPAGAEPTPATTLGAADARQGRALEALRPQVGAAHVDLEQGCLASKEGGCERLALEPFFEAAEAAARGERAKPVRVVHLGDSLIASDHITDLLRRRLEVRFGSGGRGFLFVDRPTRLSGRAVRSGEASEGWEIAKLTDKPSPEFLGVTGVRFSAAGQAPQATEWLASGSRRAELFFLTQPTGGFLSLSADGQPLARLLSAHKKPEAAFAQLSLPASAARLSLKTRGDVSLYGVSLENGRPGVVYDSLGIPGASAQIFLRSDPRVFAAQLARRAPSLVVTLLGGTEAYEMGRGWMDLEEVRGHTRSLVERIQAAAPSSACLLIGPLDAGVATLGGEVAPREHTAAVARAVREVALERGCAFWDAQAAMGGEGAAARWLAAGLMSSDLVHPLAAGADLLGHLLDFALERARLARPAARRNAPQDPPGLSGAGSLSRAFAALARTEQGGPAASLVQLGASHTASHLFTDPARAELGARFGLAGRGFVAAGRASPQLERGGVRRSLSGAWQVLDARHHPPGRRWGLTGIRAEGEPGAVFTLAFPPGDASPGELTLHYLAAPDMGELEVRVDDGPAVHLPAPGTRPAAREAAAATFRVAGASSHKLSVKVLGPGPASLFGASLDLERPGVRYDALGLPGSTAFLADGYDKPTLIAQLKERQADLYVLFWGTNESALAGLDPASLREHYVSLLHTLREASPGADCLLLGPTDRMQRAPGGPWQEAPSTEKVVATLRAIASAEGCAFWSPRAAMGGPRSMLRWQSLDPALGHPDGVHLTAAGYQALSHAFVDDLLAAYDAYRRGEAAPGAPGPDAGARAAATAAQAPPAGAAADAGEGEGALPPGGAASAQGPAGEAGGEGRR